MRILVIAVLAVTVAAFTAVTVLRSPGSGGTSGDFRDPVTLAKAVKAAEHSYSASCGKLPAGKYFCAVANTDGTSADYTVTVSPDGKSWSAS